MTRSLLYLVDFSHRRLEKGIGAYAIYSIRGKGYYSAFLENLNGKLNLVFNRHVQKMLDLSIP